MATDEAAYKLRRTSYASAAGNDPAFTWAAKYSTVSGSLPTLELPVVAVKNRSAAGSRGIGFARCNLIVETAGVVTLHLNDTSGLEIRLNELPIAPQNTIMFPVEPGTYRLTFAVDQTLREAPLELELKTEETTSVARFVN